jgi:O-antigen/teichoic acid export membrane protein
MIRKILTYASGEVLVKGVAFLAVPLYSHLIQPSEYGVLGFLKSITSFLPFILTFYYLYAYVRLSVEVEEKKLISTYFYLGLFLNMFYFLSALALYYLFIQDFSIELHYFMLSIMASSSIYMFQILQMYYRSKGMASSYMKLSVIYSLLGVSLNLFSLLYFKDNIFAMLFSSFFVSMLLSVIAYQILKQQVEWRLFDLNLVKKVLSYSIPLVPGAIALLLFSQSDKIILINYVSTAELGIYTMAFTIGLSMSYIGSAFFMSYQPLFYEKMSAGLSLEIVNQFWKNILFLISTLILDFVIIYSVYQFINPKYEAGLHLAFLIAIAYTFISFAQMMELHLTHIKKTSLVSIVYGAGGVLTLVNLWLLIPVYGDKGAAFSLLISSFVISILMYFVAQKNLYLAYNKFSLLGFYGISLSLAWIVF